MELAAYIVSVNVEAKGHVVTANGEELYADRTYVDVPDVYSSVLLVQVDVVLVSDWPTTPWLNVETNAPNAAIVDHMVWKEAAQA